MSMNMNMINTLAVAPLVSIIIPVYNGEMYIERCVSFIKLQTYRQWEAIFVNDGSTDNSREICERIVEKESGFKVVSQPNGGTARARNAGLAVANGKYVTFWDVDDEPVPEFLERMIALMERSGVDIGVCGFYYKAERIGKDGRRETAYIEKKVYPASRYDTQEELKRDLVMLWDSNILFNVWNKLYRMDLIHRKKLEFTAGHVHSEDVDFNRKLVENCGSMEIIEDCLYYYIVERSGSTTEKFWKNYFEIRDKDFHLVMEHFQRLGMWDDVSREYACRYFLERVSGVVENLFHAGKALSKSACIRRTKEILTHEDVRYASRYARCRSLKMRILVFPIRYGMVWMTLLEHWVVYRIRTANPALFYRLKNRR